MWYIIPYSKRISTVVDTNDNYTQKKSPELASHSIIFVQADELK